MSAMDTAAFEHNGVPVGRQRFYETACDPRRSVAVEACAGAGKTWMLVSRMLRALLEGCAPQDILAITFTKKAAGEMRERLQHWLLEFSTASDEKLTEELLSRGLIPLSDPQAQAARIATLRQLHTTLLRQGRPVQIRTFHSWFAALVRSAPLAVLHSLGLPTAYELLEDDKKAIAQVWGRFQARVAQDPSCRADYEQAVSTYGRHNAHKALDAALAKRTEFALADAKGVVDSSVQHCAKQFPEFAGFEHPQDYLFSRPVADLLQAAASVLGKQSQKTRRDAATDLEVGLSTRDLRAVFDALLTQKETPRKLGAGDVSGAGGRESGDLVGQAQDLLLRTKAACNQHEAWLHQQRMARLTRGLVQDYAELKRERGWIDMNDLERAALVLMSDPVLSGWVQERLDTRVRHLLIDEFQDTNPLQWQALHAWLSGYTGAGNAPSVFIVGDPKQSIYRFRRAEPQVFIAAKEFVQRGLQGEVLSCDHTRRNAPAIIDLVNGVMLDAQEAAQFEGFRAHSTESAMQGEVIKLARIARAAVSGPGTSEDGKNVEGISEEGASNDNAASAIEHQWRDSLTTPRHEEEESRKSLECRQAAQWIAHALQTRTLPDGKPLVPGDVMVLARKRERLSLMQAELAALHIPAQQPEKNDLADMPEVQDLVALLDVLVSQRHDIALARVLKSPLFGVSDDALVQLVLCQRKLQGAARAHEQERGQEQKQEREENAAAMRLRAQDSAGAPTPQAVERPVVSWLETLQRASHLSASLCDAGAKLTLWKQWVDTLPPHDALSAIYQSGDVLARYAAACTREMREGVIANLNALLHAALAVDGGRYTTAYSLVRALRAGGIKAPVRADATAVRLLTVHGAKGLESPVVLLLDTDGEALKGESMGVLVEWPGQSAHPERFVFLVSESRPSACAVDALAREQAARSREELNGLYVALTRTQQTLVISSMEPKVANPQSWWQRLDSRSHEAAAFATATATAPAPAPAKATTAQTIAAADEILLQVLPPHTRLALAGVQQTTAAPSSAVQGGAAPVESLESRIGQAMHRLLECLPTVSGGYGAVAPQGQTGLWSEDQCARVAREFALEPEAVDAALRMALGIAGGQGAWCWDTASVQWQANEVPVSRAGRILRIDRLVQDRGDCWWVLDYKSSAQPQLQADLCAQLDGYRASVQSAYPGQRVRTAFLTPQGALIETPAP